MTKEKFNKPTYCKDAIATDNGWVDPKTNELLVAIKGLKSKLNNDQQTEIISQKKKPGRPSKKK